MRRPGILLVLVAACTGKESAPSATSGSATSAPAAPAVDKPPPSIVCEKAIPAAVTERYFAGMKASHREPYFEKTNNSNQTTCRFLIDEAKNTKVLINYRCGPDFADLDAYLAALKSQIAAPVEKIPGIGRGGYKIGTSTVGAQHRSLPCVIDVDLSYLEEGSPERTKDYVPVVRDLEAALPDTI